MVKSITAGAIGVGIGTAIGAAIGHFAMPVIAESVTVPAWAKEAILNIGIWHENNPEGEMKIKYLYTKPNWEGIDTAFYVIERYTSLGVDIDGWLEITQHKIYYRLEYDMRLSYKGVNIGLNKVSVPYGYISI